MKFEEALAAMREGKKVRSKGSIDKNSYLYISDKNIFKSNSITTNNKLLCYQITSHLLLNEEWEIYEEPQKYDDEFLINDAVNAMMMVLRQRYPDIFTKEYEKGLDITTFRDRMIMGLSLELMFFRESK